MKEINLKMTCGACPEQYDALDENGNTVGYLRLRWGYFTVECPDVGGELVYSAEAKGDGMFFSDEREFYLTEAKEAIARYYSENITPELMGESGSDNTDPLEAGTMKGGR